MSWLWGLLGGLDTTVIIGALGAIGIFVGNLMGRRSGRKAEQNRVLRDGAERERKGRYAVKREQEQAQGLSSGDLAERLRRRGRD